ncbi:AbrB/MazE/SpoVT family DNA-binding domain-containing protein [Thermoproteota archaeon]
MNTQREYQVTRKLQEQRGSYFVTLPKIWVDSEDLKQGDPMSVVFNGIVKIIPPSINLDIRDSSITEMEVTDE